MTQKEIAAIITHVAFYAGWPKGWAVFAKEVWDVNEYRISCGAGRHRIFYVTGTVAGFSDECYNQRKSDRRKGTK